MQAIRKVGRSAWQVQFLNCKEEATASEEACRPFTEWGVNEDEAHIDLYNAYLLAAKEHARQHHLPSPS